MFDRKRGTGESIWDIKRNIGFDITIVTTARTNEEAKSLLSELGMPFADKAKKPTVPKTEKQQEEAPAAA